MKMSNELLIAARKAMKNSNGSMGHKIGAAVLASSGKIYGGCSLTSIPQDYCAERVALLKAVSEGERKIESILITWEGPFGRLQGPCNLSKCSMATYKQLGIRGASLANRRKGTSC